MAEQVSQEVHDRISELFQALEQEAGIVVRSVRVDWVAEGAFSSDRHFVYGIDVESYKRRG